MPSRLGSPNKNKRFLLNRLQDIYGKDFHPIMKMAENAMTVHEIASKTKAMDEALAASPDMRRLGGYEQDLAEVRLIYDALISELDIVGEIENGYSMQRSLLKIAQPPGKNANKKAKFSPTKAIVEKHSLALWFYERGDAHAAKRLDPHFRERPISNEVAPKSRNAYLKTIRALSQALLGEATGKPSKDANIILAMLDSKGIEHPVGEKTLASYLSDAVKL